MAEETINQQNEDTSPTSDDYVATWDVTTGTTKKVTLSKVKSAVMQSNPYKFSAYRNAAWTSANGSLGKVTCDTEYFDTNSNFASGTYTAPIAGFYWFNAAAQSNLNNGGYGVAALFKNGAELHRGNQVFGTAASPYSNTVSALIQLAAGDTVDFYYQGVGNAGAGGAETYFQGFLVSIT